MGRKRGAGGVIGKDRAYWLGQHVLPHEPMLRNWLQRKVRGALEVDDIVQETFAKLAELESVADIRNPRSYAFQVAFSIIQKHLRRSRIISFQSFTDVDMGQISSDTPSPETEAADRNDLKSVEHYIEALPTKCRDVIILRRIDGLSYRQISEKLNISEDSAERLLSKATNLLMEAFGRGGIRGREGSKDDGEASGSADTNQKLSKL